jgi:hypothetical protein
MRDTEYATELRSASIEFGDGSEGRIERLFVKQYEQEEIRFSWWKNGNLVMRPLDLTEDQLVTLVARGVRDGILTAQFVDKVQTELAST